MGFVKQNHKKVVYQIKVLDFNELIFRAFVTSEYVQGNFIRLGFNFMQNRH
jgi:hypothetical protein